MPQFLKFLLVPFIVLMLPTATILNHTKQSINTISAVSKNNIERFQLEKEFSNTQIIGIVEDSTQNTYLATSSSGIWEKRFASYKYTRLKLNIPSGMNITSINFVNNTVYFTYGGFLAYIANGQAHVVKPGIDTFGNVTSVSIYHNYLYCVSSNDTNSVFSCPLSDLNNPKAWTDPKFNLYGASGKKIIFNDFVSDSLYIGTANKGLFVNTLDASGHINGFEQCSIDGKPDFANSNITSINFDLKRDILVTTGEDYLAYYAHTPTGDVSKFSFKTIFPDNSAKYNFIQYDIDNNLWLITDTGIYIQDPKKNDWTKPYIGLDNTLTIDSLLSLKSGMIYALTSSADKKLVLGDYIHFRNNFAGIILLLIWLPICFSIPLVLTIIYYSRKHNLWEKITKKAQKNIKY